MDKIPYLDLKKQHQRIKTEIFTAFEKVYDEASFSLGPYVLEFEKQFAKYCGTQYAVAVNNGTNALHLALTVVGIGPGDEVIIPGNTFIATAWSVSYLGATPVFVDCLPNTWEVDPAKVESAVTSKTKAIIGVHLYGQAFDFSRVKKIADKYKLPIIEDSAQATGARYHNKVVGSLGDLACFSFYPSKNLGACGESGAVTTSNLTFMKRLHALRNHGSADKHQHAELGYNMRIGGLEAASLYVKLKYLPEWNKKRQEIGNRYLNNIKNPKISMQFQPEGVKSVFHLFVIMTKQRQALMLHLNEHNIWPGMHYPIPCHMQKAYEHLSYKKGDLPNCEMLADQCLSLPMFPELKDDHVQRVIDVVNQF